METAGGTSQNLDALDDVRRVVARANSVFAHEAVLDAFGGT
jgi:hypothetical protein